MNFFANQLRTELEKQKETYESRLNLLTSVSVDAQSYLVLESKREQLEKDLKQIKTDLNTTQQNITSLTAEIIIKDKSISDLEDKLKDLEQEKHNEISVKDKDLRDYQLYHQRELKRVTKEKQESLKDLEKKVKGLELLANHRLELLEQEKQKLFSEKSALIALAKQKNSNKKQAKELLEQLTTSWEQEKAKLQGANQAQTETISSLENQAEQLQASWSQEKQSLITEHQTKIDQLEAESSEQEQLAAQEIRKLRAKHKTKETESSKEQTKFQRQLRALQGYKSFIKDNQQFLKESLEYYSVAIIPPVYERDLLEGISSLEQLDDFEESNPLPEEPVTPEGTAKESIPEWQEWDREHRKRIICRSYFNQIANAQRVAQTSQELLAKLATIAEPE